MNNATHKRTRAFWLLLPISYVLFFCGFFDLPVMPQYKYFHSDFTLAVLCISGLICSPLLIFLVLNAFRTLPQKTRAILLFLSFMSIGAPFDFIFYGGTTDTCGGHASLLTRIFVFSLATGAILLVNLKSTRSAEIRLPPRIPKALLISTTATIILTLWNDHPVFMSYISTEAFYMCTYVPLKIALRPIVFFFFLKLNVAFWVKDFWNAPIKIKLSSLALALFSSFSLFLWESGVEAAWAIGSSKAS
jgi:hypothetical protein